MEKYISFKSMPNCRVTVRKWTKRGELYISINILKVIPKKVFESYDGHCKVLRTFSNCYLIEIDTGFTESTMARIMAFVIYNEREDISTICNKETYEFTVK